MYYLLTGLYKSIRPRHDVFNKKDIKLYKKAVKKGELESLNDCDGNDIINKKDVKCLEKLRKALKKLQKEKNKGDDDKNEHGKSHHTNHHGGSHNQQNKSHKYGEDDESHGYHNGHEQTYSFNPALLDYQAEIFFEYGEQGQLIGEYNLDGSVRQEIIYLGSTSTPIAVIKSDVLYYIFTDHLSTPRVITDINNTTVWSWHSEPFGITAANDDPDQDGTKFTFNHRFAGQYYDSETGLHYNYFRDYDPATGRYPQSDPIGLAGGLNTYAYVGSNPLSYIDPLGLDHGRPHGQMGHGKVGVSGPKGWGGQIGAITYGATGLGISTSIGIGVYYEVCEEQPDEQKTECKGNDPDIIGDLLPDSGSVSTKSNLIGVTVKQNGTMCFQFGPMITWPPISTTWDTPLPSKN